MLQFTGSQRVSHNRATEQLLLKIYIYIYVFCKLIILLLDTYPIKLSAYVHTRI